MKTFAIFFISLTTLDLTALIFVLIAYKSKNEKPGVCCNACSKPLSSKGGNYLAVKLLVEVITPQIYLFIFWWLPKRLLVSNLHPSTSPIEISRKLDEDINESDISGDEVLRAQSDNAERQLFLYQRKVSTK